MLVDGVAQFAWQVLIRSLRAGGDVVVVITLSVSYMTIRILPVVPLVLRGRAVFPRR
jgi:hypothetical protein